ncbi:MAG: hypothetical protein JRD89_03690 [Deltaproteobacteria bacterium]|nr:hypothetical protein [Deltaproteobacteria bacterium]
MPSPEDIEQEAKQTVGLMNWSYLLEACRLAGIETEGKTPAQLTQELTDYYAEAKAKDQAGEEPEAEEEEQQTTISPGPKPAEPPPEGYEWGISSDGMFWIPVPIERGPRPTELAGWGKEWVWDPNRREWVKQGMAMQDLMAQQQWAMNPYNWYTVAMINAALPKEQRQYTGYVPEAVAGMVQGLEPGQPAWELSPSATYKTGTPSLGEWGSLSGREQQQVRGWLESPASGTTFEDWWKQTRKVGPPSGYGGQLSRR